MPEEMKKPTELVNFEESVAHFLALKSGMYSNFGIMPVYVNGEQSVAIIVVNELGENLMLTPLFIAPTASMKLLNPLGEPMVSIYESDVAKEAKSFLDRIVAGKKGTD
jgi:hypothetical protein